MNVVVAGATGFVGRRLVPALARAGHSVRCGSRSPDRARQRWPEHAWVLLDVDRDQGLDEALTGCDVLVYLVHGLAADGDDLHHREQREARRVLAAAERVGIERIVYLGGPNPDDEPSPHLAARLATGEVLRSSAISAIELRASMIVGAGGESWRICRDLALRLPMMVAPVWLTSRTEPVYIDDVVAAVTHAVSDPLQGSAAFDIPGPEAMSARAILERVARIKDMKPIIVPVPFLSPRLSSLWLKFVTRARFKVARQLVDGLVIDLLATGDSYWTRMPEHTLVPFDEGVVRALRGATPPTGFEAAVEKLARAVARRPS